MELTKPLHSNRCFILNCSRVTYLFAMSLFAPWSFAGDSISLNCQALVFIKGTDISRNVGLENFLIHINGNSTGATVQVSGSTRLLLNADTHGRNSPLRRHILEFIESDFYVETSLQYEDRYERQSLRIYPSGKLMFTSWVQKNVFINAEGKCEEPWLLFARRAAFEQP